MTMVQAGINRYQQTSRIGKAEEGSRIREDKILKYASLVKYIADRMAIRLPPNITKDELISTGTVGLIDTLNNFDPSKGIKFQTYAAYRIRGAIIDELRKMDWVSRSVRKDVKRIESTITELRSRTGREPDDAEIAEEMGIDIDRYFKIISKAQGGGLLSLDELSHDDRTPLVAKLTSSSPSPFDEVKKRELAVVIAKALTYLSEKEQRVVSLYYREEMTLREIAEVLELTESRISQIHSKAIIRLRTKLKSYNEEEA